ncbi:MAG: PhzF family phenazine biosynthesis protein [Pseudomonadota bacterium]
MPSFDFHQVDVFTTRPLRGNALAVVRGAEAWSVDDMAALARWTQLSETTFLLPPTQAEADYRVRIFTPDRELPFAGHPTLGSCHVWLGTGGRPRRSRIMQECPAGLIPIRPQAGGRLAFRAPPRVRSGPVEPELLGRIAHGLGVPLRALVAAEWVDNGPGWLGLMLASRAELLALRPDFAQLAGLQLGLIAPWSAAERGDDEAAPLFEVRAFMSMGGAHEDPVTGSLNASLAQWLTGAGLAPSRYLVSQGTVLGREGRVHIERDGEEVWVGGHTCDCVQGRLSL